jgi:hypothetical protein
VVSYSESYYVSYISTAIVTITTLVPCDVYTSYTTVTQCSSCGGPGPIVGAGITCIPKTCSVEQNGIIYYSSTQYPPGSYVPAIHGGAIETAYVDPSECDAYQAFVPTGYAGAGISPCGNVIPPGPTCDLVACNLEPCRLLAPAPAGATGQVTGYAGYTPVPPQSATVVINQQYIPTPVSCCSTFTTPQNGFVYGPTPETLPTCAAGGVVTDGGTCGVSIVTYTYTTAGGTIVVATELPQNCGPFSLSGEGTRASTNGLNAMVILWTTMAILSALGMIFL